MSKIEKLKAQVSRIYEGLAGIVSAGKESHFRIQKT